MKPTLHLDVLLRPTDEGYEAHCLQFDLVEVAPTTEEAEQAIKGVITAHIEYSLAHNNGEYLFHPAPQEAWRAFFSSRPYKRVTLEIHPGQTAFPFPDTIDLQETLLISDLNRDIPGIYHSPERLWGSRVSRARERRGALLGGALIRPTVDQPNHHLLPTPLWP